MKIKYIPNPIDTSCFDIPEDLFIQIEKLAEHAHDVWAKVRIDSGWKWGVERSDKRLLSPCLVQYSDLPEQEKEYDRHLVLQIIKAIFALGFSIDRKNSITDDAN